MGSSTMVEARMKSPEEIGKLRNKMIEQLEAALALTFEVAGGIKIQPVPFSVQGAF